MDEIVNPELKEIDLSRVKYVIFDWDGTIVDSMPEYTKAFSSLLKDEFNISERFSADFFTGEAGGKALSFQLKEAISRFAHVDIQDSEDFETKFWESLKDQSPNLMPGVKEFLQELRRRGFFIVSWSGSPGDINKNVAKKIGVSDLIDFITGSERGSNIKVKGPGLFEEIAKHFNIEPEGMPK